jgi:hypothetical protein
MRRLGLEKVPNIIIMVVTLRECRSGHMHQYYLFNAQKKVPRISGGT